MATSSKKTKHEQPKGIFREIFVCSRQELSPFGTAFAFGAENFDSRKLGTIFGVIKLDDHSEDSSYVANLLVSVMKKEYFSSPQRPAEESFEASLRKANLALAELARHGSLGWSGKLNLACGALERNNLHFACLGKVAVFLFRDGQIAEISRDLQEDTDMETHPLKTFSNISSGKLEKNDKLIFSTDDLIEVFSKEELRQNAAHFSRGELPGFLEMSLAANAELAGTVVIDFVEALKVKPLTIEAPIIGKEKISAVSPPPQISEVSRPVAGAKKLDSFTGVKEPTRMSEFAPAEPEISLTFWQKSAAAAKNAFFSASGAAKRALAGLISSLHRLVQNEKIKKFNLKKPVSAIYNSSKYAGRSLATAKNRFQSLGTDRKKIIAGVLSAVVVIVAVGLIINIIRNNKTSQPESSVPESAQSEITLALGDINARKIESLSEFANLPEEESRIAMLGSSLFAVSGNDRKIVSANLETGATEEFASSVSSGNFELIAAMPDLGTVFVLTGDRKIISFTPINKNFQENGINLPSNLKSQNIRTYLTYLYVLDTANNQIYRYPRAEGGFGEGQNWLRTTTDLASAKGIAINDDLYLAASDGITPYIQGRKDDEISFESPQTPLSIDRIYSEPGMEFVWVLDDKNHRVVRFTKDGRISAQYFNESVSEAKDLAVDEKNKTVYLLLGNSIQKFSFE